MNQTMMKLRSRTDAISFWQGFCWQLAQFHGLNPSHETGRTKMNQWNQPDVLPPDEQKILSEITQWYHR